MSFEKICKKPKAPPTRLLPMDDLLARPCEADGRPALFHRWVEEDRALLKINTFTRLDEQEVMARRFRKDGVIPECCAVEVVRETFALVEYRDGTVGMVRPEVIRFVDKGGRV